MDGKSRLVSCPRCGKDAAWSVGNPYRPFCSQRCKMIDLGAWANEAYRIPVAENKDRPPDEDIDGAA